MRQVIELAGDCGDGVGVDRSQAIHTFFKGLGGVCLGSVAGAGLGAALFFAAEVVLPKQADAAPAHTVAKTLKHQPKLTARQTILYWLNHTKKPQIWL